MGLPSPSGTTAARLLKALAAAIAAGAALILAFLRGGAAAPGDPRLVLVGTFTSPRRGKILIASSSSSRRAGSWWYGRAQLGSPFLDIRSLVSTGGERGLLSLAFPPDYASSGRFYVYYTARDPAGTITIAEYRTSSGGDRADANTRRTVLSIPHPRSNHNGGQLQFGPDGYLYIGTGDGGGGGDPDRAGQRLDTLLGKLLRIDLRAAPAGEPYTVPADNPFAGLAGARREIWSYGLRNPWRFSFDRQTADLTIADVGQNSWEEIDLAPASSGRGRGANFGWGCWSRALRLARAGRAEPACS